MFSTSADLKAAKYEKQNPHPASFKRADDIFDTKTLNLADVFSFSPCVINLSWQIVEINCSFIKPTTCHAQDVRTFRDKLRVCVSREAVSKLTMPHESFHMHVEKNPTLNPHKKITKTTGATIGYNVRGSQWG